MTREEIFAQIQKKKSFLCVGLDTDIKKIPKSLLKEADPIFAFNKAIIDATAQYCVAYKPNIAFYESLGPKGWESLQKTLGYIPKDIFTIADAKRGDIGNTSALYARAFFDPSSSGLSFDAVTVAPYMGEDSVRPFLSYPNKWVILLALTSNVGSNDFQRLALKDENALIYEKVLSKSITWGSEDELMFVVGATQAEQLESIRKLIPNHFLLVPGVGAQGGDLAAVAQYGMNKQCGLLVNAARSIIYASSGEDFAEAAAKEAEALQTQMAALLGRYL